MAAIPTRPTTKLRMLAKGRRRVVFAGSGAPDGSTTALGSLWTAGVSSKAIVSITAHFSMATSGSPYNAAQIWWRRDQSKIAPRELLTVQPGERHGRDLARHHRNHFFLAAAEQIADA